MATRKVLMAAAAAFAVAGVTAAALPGDPDVVEVPEAPPANVAFDLGTIGALTEPTVLARGKAPITVPLFEGVNVVDCDDLSEWFGATVPRLAGYDTTCGVAWPGEALPERHGKEVAGQPLEYEVALAYSPSGVDAEAVSAPEAYSSGTVTVAIYYGPQSWNGTGYPQEDTASNPNDPVNGGFAIGKISEAPAIVQRTPDGYSRAGYTPTVGGDALSISFRSTGEPIELLAFSGTWAAQLQS